MSLRWISKNDRLPEHNSDVFVQHRSGGLYVCIFKKINNEDCFVPIDPTSCPWPDDIFYIDDSKDWNSKYHWDKAYVDYWVPFKELGHMDYKNKKLNKD